MTSAAARDLVQLSSQRGCAHILVDIGGVLVPDTWEHMVDDPAKELQRALGVPRHQLAAVAERIWPFFATARAATTREWFIALCDELGAHTCEEYPDIAAIQRRVAKPFPSSDGLLASLISRGLSVGIISDNTRFWYEYQEQELGLGDLDLHPFLLSFELGIRKKDHPTGLYDLAKELVDPTITLVVDDRLPNLERAAQLGFRTCLARVSPGGAEFEPF